MHVSRIQHRVDLARPGAVDDLEAPGERAGVFEKALGHGLLVLAREEQHAARRHQRMVGKPGRRRVEERAAGLAQRAHDPVAVTLGKKGDRAAGAVIAGRVLGFEQRDTEVR